MVIILALAGVVLLWYLMRRSRNKGLLRQIPGPPSTSILTGNLTEFFDPQGWDFNRSITQGYGTVVKLNGLFNTPVLYVSDTEALQHIFAKDPGAFDQADETMALFTMILGPGMLMVPGDTHRRQRRVVNPAFSLNNLRSMLPLFHSVTTKFCNTVARQLSEGPAVLDMHYWLNRVAFEILGQAGLGHSFDSLTEEGPSDQYEHYMKRVIALALHAPWLRIMLPYLVTYFSHGFLRSVLQYSPDPTVRELAKCSSYLVRRAKQIYEAKKFALQQGDDVLAQQVGEGKDVMSLLMRANLAASEKDQLPMMEVIGQITLMSAAGTDTTANSTSRLLHQLASRQDIQEKVRNEILEAGNVENLSFDDLMQLPWLNAVVKETLRLDPPVPYADRRVVKDTVLPLSQPIRCVDGSFISAIPLAKGDSLFLGIHGCNLRKDLWGEDALEWKPERWLCLPPATNAIPGIHANLMSFVGGPRACIGFKFGELEMKVIAFMLLSRFTFELTEKSISWNLAQVCYPTVGSEEQGSLPLKICLYQN